MHVPRASGPQQFAKAGPRNAMVIAVCSLALALHPDRYRVGTGIGSAGPVPLVAAGAERVPPQATGGPPPVPDVPGQWPVAYYHNRVSAQQRLM